MTLEEATAKIVNLWRIGHTPEAIMMTLLMYRVALQKREIMIVIRRYCDNQSENTTYKAHRRKA